MGEIGFGSASGPGLGYTERLRAYLEANPAFYGTAAALLDETGNVTASPYVHRSTYGYRTLDLAEARLQHPGAGVDHDAVGGRRRCLDAPLLRCGRR